MKHSLKNTLPLSINSASPGKKKIIKKKWFPVPGKRFLKLVPPIGFQQLRKSSEQKDTVSTRQKISFH